MIEYIGYLASVFLGISLVVKVPMQFRVFNALGCIAFIIYGVLRDANPVILANGVLLVLNLFQIYKLITEKKN